MGTQINKWYVGRNLHDYYPYFLGATEPFKESPVPKKSLKDFYKAMRQLEAKSEDINLRLKITNKFADLKNYFIDPTRNPNAEEAHMLFGIINGEISASDLTNIGLIKLYCYFKYEFRFLATFLEDEIKKLNIFFENSVTEEILKDSYDLRYPVEVKRLCTNVVNDEHVLTAEEAFELSDKFYTCANPEEKRKIRIIRAKSTNCGKSIGLNEVDLQKEYMNLYSFISSDEFEKEYGHKYSIVDMYLTTNLQLDDILNVSNVCKDTQVAMTISVWFKYELSPLIPYGVHNVGKQSANNLHARAIAPVNGYINKMKRDETQSNEYIDLTISMLESFEYRYGVEFNLATLTKLHELLYEYDPKELKDSFDEIGNRFKDILDQKSFIEYNEPYISARRIAKPTAKVTEIK
ncbi:MAG: hypothetical protein K6G37_00485 [Bacilli bacterium]|nr:hypothetical protein [Bacilli bacterium]